MGILKGRHEAFAQGVASGLSAKDAYIAAGYRTTEEAARVSATRLLANDTVAERIREIQEKLERRVEAAVSLDRTERIARLEKRSRELDQIIASRKADPEYQNIPGGSTGLLCKTLKIAGREVRAEFQVDVALLREMRAIEQAAAQELGEWLVKTAVDIRTDMPVVEVPEGASIEDIRLAKQRLQAALSDLQKPKLERIQ